MSKIDHVKRNSEDKLKRSKGLSISKRRSEKASTKQIAFMKKLGIKPDKNMNKKTASLKISEALKSV